MPFQRPFADGGSRDYSMDSIDKVAGGGKYSTVLPLGSQSTVNLVHGDYEKASPYAGAGLGSGVAASQRFAPPQSNNKRAAFFKSKKFIVLASIAGGVLLIAAVAGGLAASRVFSKSSSAADKDGSPAVSVLPDGQTTTAAPTSTSKSTPSISPLPIWNWEQSNLNTANTAVTAGTKNVQGPMVAAALGNWLILEKWMSETWFNQSANWNASVVDEWNLMLALGDNATSVMQEHYDTWVTEDDIENLYQSGINQLRVPLGFWAFIDTISPEPYLSKAGQLTYVDRLLGWAYKRNMYVMIDLHGLPGSQNGEITSGVMSRSPHFFQDASQARSRATVDAALAWITASPYRSIISGLGVCNEPRPYTQQQFDMLQALYQYSYDQSVVLKEPVPIIFHHGYPNFIFNTSYTEYWADFVSNKTAGLIAMEDHPYPGTFPLATSQTEIEASLCKYSQMYKNFPAPILITEWSIRTGISDLAFEQSFYEKQALVWAKYANGGVFWNFKTLNGTGVNANNIQYSFLDLLNAGAINPPASGQGTLAYLNSLTDPCADT